MDVGAREGIPRRGVSASRVLWALAAENVDAERMRMLASSDQP